MAVILYVGEPECGKSTLMREHVYKHAHPFVRHFLIVDHQDDWEGRVYYSAKDFRRGADVPRYSCFRGVSGVEVARLAVELGNACVVDPEVHKALRAEPWKPGHPLYDIGHEGRHLRNASGEVCPVDLLGATHRPANVGTDFLALAKRVYVGHLKSWADAERAYREGWVRGARSVKEAQAILFARGVGEFSVYP